MNLYKLFNTQIFNNFNKGIKIYKLVYISCKNMRINNIPHEVTCTVNAKTLNEYSVTFNSKIK